MVDSLIRIYESTETAFTTNGLGCLSSAISCIVTEERNGEFELEMEYPITGMHYSELSLRRLITAKPNPTSDPQPFRIYAISKPIDGIVTVNAEHISYDLNGYVASPFTAASASAALSSLTSNSAVTCPFIFSTNKTGDGTMEVTTPSTIRSLLGGTEGSILDIFGGEYEFDKFNVKLWENRGSDRGMVIRYGKNLTDLEQEENCSAVYTGVYPYWYSETDGLVTLTDKIVNCDGTFNYTRILPLDFSQNWTDKPSEDDLKEAAEDYISNNSLTTPKVSLDVSFVSLRESPEYADYAIFETINLCDTVTVIFEDLGVSTTAKCVKTEFDVLTDQYESIEIGEASSDLASTIAGQTESIEETSTKSFLDKALEFATKRITGNLGGYVIMRNSAGTSKYPDEICIMDTDDITTATKVWRWNLGGLGYSNQGYDPDKMVLAITMDGEIVADFITTGTMSASRINGGTLVMGGLDNTNGIIYIRNANNEDKIIIDASGIDVNNGKFKVDMSGNVTCNNVTAFTIVDKSDAVSQFSNEVNNSEAMKLAKEAIATAQTAADDAQDAADTAQSAANKAQKTADDLATSVTNNYNSIQQINTWITQLSTQIKELGKAGIS